MHVELQPVGSRREPTIERGHGVLRAQRTAAPVSKDTRGRRALEESHD
jgi:hypothetical protein